MRHTQAAWRMVKWHLCVHCESNRVGPDRTVLGPGVRIICSQHRLSSLPAADATQMIRIK